MLKGFLFEILININIFFILVYALFLLINEIVKNNLKLV